VPKACSIEELEHFHPAVCYRHGSANISHNADRLCSNKFMAKFGRFEFKATEPAETYEGDYMELDSTGHVRIFRGEPRGTFMSEFSKEPRLLFAIQLDQGQSMREIESEPVKAEAPAPSGT
jgi:hypothetical protein